MRNGTNDFIVLDMDKENASYIKPCEIVDNVEFIPLETREECIIGSYDKILVLNDTIYVFDKMHQKAVFVFNIEGHFLYRISAIGRGPGEYFKAYDFYVDTVSSHIGILDYGRIQKYNFRGEYIEQVAFSGHLVSHICFNRNKYNGTVFTTSTKDKSYLFAQYNNKGQLIYRDHPTPNELINFEMGKDGYFSVNSNGAYFNDYASDTIYHITDSCLKPAFVLNYGNSLLSQDLKKQLYQKTSGEIIQFFRQNPNLVFFGLLNFSISDKYIFLDMPYGDTKEYVIYSIETNTLKFLDFKRHWSLLYPISGITFCNDFGVSRISSRYINEISGLADDDQLWDEKVYNSPWFYQNIKDYKNIKETDNDIICIFKLKDF